MEDSRANEACRASEDEMHLVFCSDVDSIELREKKIM